MKIFNLKTVFAVASLFCFNNTVDAGKVDLYAKILPSETSLNNLVEKVGSIFKEVSDISSIKVLEDIDYHMTINKFTYDDNENDNNTRGFEINLFDHQDTNKITAYKKLKKEVQEAIDIISKVPFIIKNISSNYGGQNKFITLELTPDYKKVKDSNIKKACEKLLEDNPHLTLARFTMEEGIARDKLKNLTKKVKEALTNYKEVFYFDKAALQDERQNIVLKQTAKN
jgi:hypothetical protein